MNDESRESFEEYELRSFKNTDDFEVWKKHILERNKYGRYQALFTEDHWVVWQAAVKWATERQIKKDAEICESLEKRYEEEWVKQKSICDTNLEGCADGTDYCKEAILAQLKQEG